MPSESNIGGQSNPEPQEAPAGHGHDQRKYTYFVDGKPYHTDSQTVTGAQIKSQIPDFNQAYQLVLEGRGDQPDRIISDQDSIDLDKHPWLQFYVAPPATFGS